MKDMLKDVPEGFPTVLGENVVVDVSHALKVAKATEKTSEGGIIFNEEVKHEDKIATSGYVIGVGEDCKHIEVGDRIVLPVATQALMQFTYEGKPENRLFSRVFERNVPAVFKN